MASSTITLIRSQKVAEGTLALYFEKPAGFEFKAGQCARLQLIDPPETDEQGNGRIFSLASAPFEKELMMATRLRQSAFKRVLAGLAPGTELVLKGPYGSFTLHHDQAVPAVLITGGIGVTPLRSMLLQARHERQAPPLVVFYANRRPEDAAFLDDLTLACNELPHCTLVPTMTRMAESGRPWQGETGYLDQAMLARYVPDLSRPLYYLDGPPGMVDAMQRLLNRAGVADDNIRVEEFAGY
ncbi:oxidoreductase [Zobellella endophytica]|uniref:Oxidoreductase n=1 Tax=Zobellella endophytica TaxID=2116700 RepID=A0A2P7R2H5_9GAMM|nr:FAD-dependent oxidoreductase [Zobellella endophytica]PSJ44409.1 oxidoreductase [Zobellella endophytica]